MIVGFVVGEAVSVGANRKRARELAPIAVACLFLGVVGLGLALASNLGGASDGIQAANLPIAGVFVVDAVFAVAVWLAALGPLARARMTRSA